MSREIFLRDYRSADLDAMFRLDETCFAEEFRFDWRSMREFAEEPDAVVRVAETERGIAGFVIAHMERMPVQLCAYVVTLDVAPEYRRHGLARSLMNEMELRVAAAGARWIHLHVFTGNEGAIRFYEQMGYERIGMRRRFYGRVGLDAFVYGKELPGVIS
jgi:ribosomal-protein-alanine N-acetyltransferase